MRIPKFNDFTKGKVVKENEEPQVFVDKKEKESMVQQNLWHISKKAMEIHDDLKKSQDTEIPEWIQEILASLNDRMNTVTDYLGYQLENGSTEEFGSQAVDLDQSEEIEDMEDEEGISVTEPLAMLESPEDTEEETDEELEESKKSVTKKKSILLEKFQR